MGAFTAGIGSRTRPLHARTSNDFDLSDALVAPDAILHGGPPRDGIPSIDAPRFVEASSSGLRDTDRVLE